ncbi:MAG: methyltransferase domain-containing protein [Acidimicrobiales bacterium]|jgi:SAM-dependent methyltransferase
MNHPIFARIYARRSVGEAHLQEAYRRELLHGLSGRILEVGCGNGLNFAYYPPPVTEVVGVEPERYLRRQAQLASMKSRSTIQVVEGQAETVSEVVTGTFDAVVFSLVLCSVSDPRAVLAEAKKVLNEGAAVRVYEHVLSDDPRTARLQRLFAPVWSSVAGGCRPDRDTLSVIREEFDISGARAFNFCPGCRIPLGIVAPHVLAQGVFRST